MYLNKSYFLTYLDVLFCMKVIAALLLKEHLKLSSAIFHVVKILNFHTTNRVTANSSPRSEQVKSRLGLVLDALELVVRVLVALQVHRCHHSSVQFSLVLKD